MKQTRSKGTTPRGPDAKIHASLDKNRQRLIRAAWQGRPPSRSALAAWARRYLEERFQEDAGTDVTVAAVIADRRTGLAHARILAKQDGILSGLEEVLAFYRRHGVSSRALSASGEAVTKGQVLAELSGREADLLRVERTGLNVLQRLSGIATATRRLVDRAAPYGTAVVGTRKTLLPPLDKQAIACGGGLPHRYGLHDAILVKDNHLAAIAAADPDGDPLDTALERALSWRGRPRPAFVEIEVPSPEDALHLARLYQTLRVSPGAARRYPLLPAPFLIMLDNMSPARLRATVAALEAEGLREGILLEASGGIDERTFDAFVRSGVDAVSIGAVTHSVIALDISQKIVARDD